MIYCSFYVYCCFVYIYIWWGCWIPWNSSYKQLWAATWGGGIKRWSSGRAAKVLLTGWAISPAYGLDSNSEGLYFIRICKMSPECYLSMISLSSVFSSQPLCFKITFTQWHPLCFWTSAQAAPALTWSSYTAMHNTSLLSKAVPAQAENHKSQHKSPFTNFLNVMALFGKHFVT